MIVTLKYYWLTLADMECNSRPLFDRDVWSHHGILRGKINNAAEGFHSKINKLINMANLCFSEVLNIFKDI